MRYYYSQNKNVVINDQNFEFDYFANNFWKF